tara:strand:- start:353 stop:829 length:477 start_codon:yes stop_codon:yes gene_type:complete
MRCGLLSPLVVVFVDQLSKLFVLQLLRPYETIPLTSFLNCVLVFNKGVSFGLFAGEGALLRYAFIALALSISLGLSIWLYFEKRLLFFVALSLILGGALSNVVDRIVRRAVVDFIDFYIGSWHWPAFNLADSAITIGVGLYFFASLRDYYRNRKLEYK